MSDCELPSAYVHLERKAIKDHRSCECHGVITKGELYHVHKGVWDGRGDEFKNCADCESIRCDASRSIENDEYGCGVPYCQLRDYILDNARGDVCDRLIGALNAVADARKPA
jgi:hypothetical protein